MTMTYQIIFFAVYLSIDVIKGFSPQSPAAGAADKAVGVVQLVHGLASLPSSSHLLPTRGTIA
jgi:hypothetical protein